ncbi:DUF7524 family protein [Candidatus Halobonum tyrrellensis]|uniref:Uncharacterized protein n=1 Tax=Candidatus Halobonum tyrrellensis G22 TaxID=1324957 RepID=V4HI46_9EURY|nr:hypothetical protein [Candidatus Halobonum tyrrellensis]ESP89433.1 hypothetical protein K933_04011 [Candidatus Halobonum tyrrellensis G22]
MSTESAPLAVALNRDRLNQAVVPESYAAEGSFTVRLRNEGEAAHVHLRFVGPLSEVASVATSNHYVDGDSTSDVRVEVADIDDRVRGGLEVVTGHGAEGEVVEVTVDPPARSGPVEVDETLSRPRTEESSDDPRTLGDTVGGLFSASTPTTYLVVGLAVAALLVAFVLQTTFQSVALTLGLLAVVVAVAGALYVLFS